jgi:hypothetical protein
VAAGPGTNLNGTPESGPISQIAGALDNTTKTRALFEINKGVNKVPSISVNDSVPEDERRVPFKNMIYVADGPSDIPSFSVVLKHGGYACAVYDPRSKRQYDQAAELLESDRVSNYDPADYQEGTPTSLWLERQVLRIAKRMVEERKHTTMRKVGRGPTHVDEG